LSTFSTSNKILKGAILAIVLALIVAKLFFIGFYTIPQNGMYPGLPAGSRLFTVRHAYGDASSVKRGDIIVFIQEVNGQRYNYIWRVIALPGEKVVASGDSLTVNGQPAQRQRLREVEGRTIYREQIGDASYEVAFAQSPQNTPPEISVTVPPNEFFVLGDNRSDAQDSRYLGTIQFSSIIGKKL
jgi:signal peptidase I